MFNTLRFHLTPWACVIPGACVISHRGHVSIEVWHLASASSSEFEMIHCTSAVLKANERTLNEKWAPPVNGCVKVNCDASVDCVSGEACVAAIIRDCNGDVVGEATKKFRTSSIAMVEACAIRLGLLTAINGRFQNVLVESDNESVVSRIKTEKPSAWESAAMEYDILEIMSSFSSVSISYIKRICNRTADWMHARCDFRPENWVTASLKD
ncbi:hypothetical protein GQ457_17G013080 [Hibiscus cannabinus]